MQQKEPVSFSLVSWLRAAYWTLGDCSNNEKKDFSVTLKSARALQMNPTFPDAPIILRSIGPPCMAVMLCTAQF